jgi:ATP-binding cassette subfamily F protein 3
MRPIAAQLDERVKPFYLPNPAKAVPSPLMRFEDVAIG